MSAVRVVAAAGALVALLCAPLVAIADGLHAGNFAGAPAYAAATREALAPALGFVDPFTVMRVWQAILAVGLLAALALLLGIARLVRHGRRDRAGWALVALLPLALGLTALLPHLPAPQGAALALAWAAAEGA